MAPGGTPGEGYMILHWVAPQQSLMSASPVLATVGLLGGGSAFFSARELAEDLVTLSRGFNLILRKSAISLSSSCSL